LVEKTKAAGRGDLKRVRRIDLEVKKLLLHHGIVHSPEMTKVHVPALTENLMLKETREREAYLRRYGVPHWFREGYDNRLRAQLWLRLSRRFRDHLKAENRAGKLPHYLPSPSYWAKTIKPSDFKESAVTPAEVAGIAAKEGVDPALVAATISGLEAQDAELADIEQELAGEDVEVMALMDSLEQPGLGQLASEEKWYQDPLKIAIVGVASLLFLSAVK